MEHPTPDTRDVALGSSHVSGAFSIDLPVLVDLKENAHSSVSEV